MKVYSPSQTATWMRCPMMRALRKEGWIPRYGQRKDWAAVLGQAFGAGVGAYNSLRQAHEEQGMLMPERAPDARASFIDVAVGVALGVKQQRVREMVDMGLVVDEDGDAYIKVLDQRIRRAVTCYVLTDPIPDTWKIVDIESSLGEGAGNARPDLIVRDEMGLAIVDYKSKLTLKAEYRHKTIQEYANGHQFLHYAHFGREYYKEPIDRYYIGLAVLEPRWAFELIPFPVHDETLKVWYQGASTAWAMMEREDAGEQVPWLSDRHSDQFGQCPYYRMCFTHMYDPGLAKQDYILTERVTEAA